MYYLASPTVSEDERILHPKNEVNKTVILADCSAVSETMKNYNYYLISIDTH